MRCKDIGCSESPCPAMTKIWHTSLRTPNLIHIRIGRNYLSYMRISEKLLRMIPIDYSRGFLWNAASYAVTGLTGLILYLLIMRNFGAAALGVFSQLYAVHIIASQAAVFGIHLSVLSYASRYSENGPVLKTILSSGVAAALPASLFISFLLYFGRSLAGEIFNSQGVADGLRFIAPAVFLFALNKIFLAYFNSRKMMRVYAVGNIVRAVFMLTISCAVILGDYSPKILPLLFLAGESAVFIFSMAALFAGKQFNPRSFSFEWIKKHIRFGIRVAPGNSLADANTRVDVLMLGILVRDTHVGIYSMASVFIEGFHQFANIFRISVTPLISEAWYGGGAKGLKKHIQKAVSHYYRVLVPAGLAVLFSFPAFSFLISGKEFILYRWGVLIVLMTGALSEAGYFPFRMVFSQTGSPGIQTSFTMISFFSNVFLNLALIPLFGIYGAAAATAVSFFLRRIILKKMLRKVNGINL